VGDNGLAIGKRQHSESGIPMTQLSMQHRFSVFKRTLPRFIWQPVRKIMTGLLTPLRFSVKSGHWRSSMTMTACTQSGEPLPWYTYPAIDFLTQRNFGDRDILEFGGGQSTLWWSRHARSVLTIEEDAEWYERLHFFTFLQMTDLAPSRESGRLSMIIRFISLMLSSLMATFASS
jgi:hypothetical protein